MKLENAGGTPLTVRPSTCSWRYSPIKSNGPTSSQASTLHAVLSSALGRINGEREPSSLTSRLPDGEIFVPCVIAAVEHVAAQLKKGSLTENVFEQGCNSRRPTYMKLLLSLTRDVAAVAVENPGVIRQQILLLRPNAGERFPPKLAHRSADQA